jgi:hypothetical protein
MNLKTYIDLNELLQRGQTTRQERRAFGLAFSSTGYDPAAQLREWVEVHRQTLNKPLVSEQVDTLLYHTTLVLALVAYVLGLFSGIGLLSYSGEEPVNLIYFLAMVLIVPLITMGLSLFAMLRANRARNLLVHISPAYWMERLMMLFSKEDTQKLSSLKINPQLFNWMVIKRSQMLALIFSLGLLSALLGVVATHDIAFAWSTTLDLSDKQFYTFVHTVAFPWRSWLPSAVPSLELVVQSHYFRLGGKVSEVMISHAALLGTWWKFLAMSTLFYAVVLRIFLLLLATAGCNSALQKALLTLDGVKQLLRDMNEPLITTQARENETLSSHRSSLGERTLHRLDRSYDIIQGWAFSRESLVTACDTYGVVSSGCYEVGGKNTLEEDREVLLLSHGEVLLFVKAWEPPTMDFVDYLEMLHEKAKRVVVVPIGTAERDFIPSAKELDVWVRKITGLFGESIWIKV